MASESKLEQVRNTAYAMLEVADGDVTQLPTPLKNLVLIDSAQALIDNGGLEYFFYYDFPSKPAYQIFVDAYQAIGANSAAQIIAKASMAFGIEQPEFNIKQRRKHIDLLASQTASADEFLKLSDLICGDDSIWALLEQYADAITLD
jgi:hypothetical protein